MFFFILPIFCNLLSLGYLQETNNVDDLNSMQPSHTSQSAGGDWPLQTFHTIQGNFYSQAQRTLKPPPCSRRSNSEPGPIEQLSPPSATKVERTNNVYDAATLKPQALKNYNLRVNPNLKPPLSQQSTVDDGNSHKSGNSLTVSNPVIDSLEENHRAVLPSNSKEIQEDNSKLQLRSEPSSDSNFMPNSEVLSAASKSFKTVPASVFRFVPSNEYGAEPENQYLSSPSNVITSEHNEFRSTLNNNIRSHPTNSYFPEEGEYQPVHTHSVAPPPIQRIHSEPSKPLTPSKINETASNVLNKCSHEKEPNQILGHSRRSMSSDDNGKDHYTHEKETGKNNNDRYIESHIDNENALASVLNVEKNAVKVSQDQKLENSDKSKVPSHEKSIARTRPQFNEARREMIEPTKGNGITNMAQSALMLMHTERICYACSTANNPTCWEPDRRTTVKYCKKGNNACITKTFGAGSTFTLIRDCGKSCDDSEMGGLMPKYKSCSMCHSELCNGAYTIGGKSIIFALILIAIIKYLN